MIRISGVNIQDNLPITFALTRVHGIGMARAKKILQSVGFDTAMRSHQLTDEQIRTLQVFIDQNFKVEGILKSEVSDNIKRLREIHTYRGWRHIRGLPVRGQRTRSNACTRKGKKRTVGALSKEAWAKVDQTQASNSK